MHFLATWCQILFDRIRKPANWYQRAILMQLIRLLLREQIQARLEELYYFVYACAQGTTKF